MTTEAIPYDELLAAHQEVVRQRDLARKVAVALEQELALAQEQLRDVRRQLHHALSATGGAA